MPLFEKQADNLLNGAIDLAAAALDGGVAMVEDMHTNIACQPFAALRLVPAVGETSEAVREIHDGITRLVYGGIRFGLRVGAAATRMATASTSQTARPGSKANLALAALNGVCGDRLERSGSPLTTQMSLHHQGAPLAVERGALAAAFPNASSRVAVFVHGLAGNETLWRWYAERHYGENETTYGSLLAQDLGYTPLYVRYNTGLHISRNGRQLAQCLRRVFAEWPTPITEIALVGHSMGGLVIRSAAHYGRERSLDWVQHARHFVYLGSPHRGAPLEKLTNVAAWTLARFAVTQPLAAALNERSVGIKDLRFGCLLDDDWQDVDVDGLCANRAAEVPLLESAQHLFITATVTHDHRHPVSVVLGDLLVRPVSASGGSRQKRSPLASGQHVGAITHLQLLNHPSVYEQIRSWMEGSLQ